MKFAKNEKNVIYFERAKDVRFLSVETIKTLLDALCGFDQFSIETCETLSDKNNTCWRNVTEMISGCYNGTMVKCEEKYCNCEEIYPWENQPCSVTCGDGVKQRPFLPTKCNSLEMDCNTAPCPKIKLRISGPLDLVVILDNSKSFRSWHLQRKKILKGIYVKVMNFIVDNFEIGLNETRLAIYCTSDETMHPFKIENNIDDIRKRECDIDIDYPDNLHEKLKFAADTLSGPESRNNVEKAIFGKKTHFNIAHCYLF